jgi:hypothetical protein
MTGRVSLDGPGAGAGRAAGLGTVTVGRSAPVLLLVVTVAVVVTIASNGFTLLSPRHDLAGAWTWGVRLCGVVLVAAGIYGLLAPRRHDPGERVAGKATTVGATRTAATIMAVVTLFALLNPPPPSDADVRDGVASGLPGRSPFGGSPLGEGSMESRSRGGESQISGNALPDEIDGMEVTAQGEEGARPGLLPRVVGLLPWIFLLAMVVMIHRAMRRKVRVHELRELDVFPPVAEKDVARGLEASLAAIGEYGRDARGQITLAYHRLLSALAAAGAPREPQEAPHEHLRRALVPLGVQPEPLHRLAGLYVLAQFSERPLGERHRTAAVDALERSLEGLGAAASAPDPGGFAAGGALS